jgi:phosphoribosylformylglycinamidine synthase
VSIDGSGRKVAADPYRGTIGNVLECAANIACVGGEPLGLTNCLNFGNPEKPHIAWQLTESVKGMRDACRALDLPVVGGNVSLYNQSSDGPIYPTPVVGIVGGVPDPAIVATNTFSEEGLFVGLIGPFEPNLGASELAKLVSDPLPTKLPDLDLAKHAESLKIVRDAVRAGTIKVARDISEGGLATTLAECSLGGVGAEIDITPLVERVKREFPDAETHQHARTALFGEGPGGIVVAGTREDLLALSSTAAGVGFLALGTTGGQVLSISEPTGTLNGVSLPASEIQRIHGTALSERVTS